AIKFIGNRNDIAAVHQAQVDNINGNFGVVAGSQHTPGCIFDSLRRDRAIVLVTYIFSWLETQGIAVYAFDPVQSAFDHDRIASTQLLGNGSFATFFCGNRRTVRNRHGRAIPADYDVCTRVTPDWPL